VGQGQYSQSYGYDPATGNLASKNDVGAYSYSPAKPHAVTSAGAMNYQYDANGNMVSRNGQLISYDAENHLTAFAGKTWLYDGDGKRVAEINADGTATIFIGNYFEGAYPEPEPPAQPPQPNKVYLPIVLKGGVSFEPIAPRMGTLYFYADGQRIAMKKDGAVYYLYGDQLGSVGAVADANGSQISTTLYHPWGTTRHTQGASPTDYAYTGQMREGDVYFYNARWYDPTIGRFMQADTFVPTSQGTQGFDRFAYINNNPVNGTDPTGMWMCGDQYDYGCRSNNDEADAFASMEFGLGINNGQAADRLIPLDDKFRITFYIQVREDDPEFADSYNVNVPGLSEQYNYKFIYDENYGIFMQGSGKAINGKDITIDWSNSNPAEGDWKFTYGLGGNYGTPVPWKTVASGDARLLAGSRIAIEGFPGQIFTVNDTGSGVGANHIDIFIGPVFIKDAFDLGELYRHIGIFK